MDNSSNPVVNKNVTFKVNETILGSATTDSNGVAILLYNVTQTKGTYNIHADFAGDKIYTASNGNGSLTIGIKNTQIIVSQISAYNGQSINLTAKLMDNSSNPVANKTVLK